MQHNSKIFIEAGQRGISKLTLESADGETGLRFLKHSLPALRLFDSFIRETETLRKPGTQDDALHE